MHDFHQILVYVQPVGAMHITSASLSPNVNEIFEYSLFHQLLKLQVVSN